MYTSTGIAKFSFLKRESELETKSCDNKHIRMKLNDNRIFQYFVQIKVEIKITKVYRVARKSSGVIDFISRSLHYIETS